MANKKKSLAKTKAVAAISGDIDIPGENFRMRLAGYLRALGLYKKQIAEALSIDPDTYSKRYHDHPQVVKYCKEYENKLAVQLEADYKLVLKELRGIAFTKVQNINAAHKLRALENLARLHAEKTTPSSQLPQLDDRGGMVEMAAVRYYVPKKDEIEKLGPDELKERINQRIKAFEGIGT